MSAVRTTSARRGFSLVELLMAIFILGIGVISIAALFPAGIAQQRRAVDDVTGSLVANNALAIIRGKVEAADFGTFEEYNFSPPRVRIGGDWTWIRPAVMTDGSGDLDVFGANVAAGNATPDPIATYAVAEGMPRSSFRWFNAPPQIIIPQEERFYPQGTGQRPQYYWDCMFRRFQGKILVAVFVYRVGTLGGEPGAYAVSTANVDAAGTPVTFVPQRIDLFDTSLGGEPWRGEPWDAYGDPVIPLSGAADGNPMDWRIADHAWQLDGQWILDQNNNIHRVLAGRRRDSDGRVELVRPVPELAQSVPTPIGAEVVPIYSVGPGGVNDGRTEAVTDIWYIPAFVSGMDANGVQREFRLTPVYATVKEL